MLDYLQVYIINYCWDNNYRLSNLRLNQILYCIYAVYREMGKPIFSKFAYDFKFLDGAFVTIPEVYHRWKLYGALEIPKQKKVLVFDSNDIYNSYEYIFKFDDLPKKDKKIIDEIITICAFISLDKLSFLVNLPKEKIAHFFKAKKKEERKKRRLFSHGNRRSS